MNDRFSEELFLTNETGKMLYHKYAEHMPIIDYHCHLSPAAYYRLSLPPSAAGDCGKQRV